MNIIEVARKNFKSRVLRFGKTNDLGRPDPYGLIKHVDQVERWAGYLCDNHPHADRQVVMLAVWLHDIGHYPLPSEIDHAVRSENLAKSILLREKYNSKKLARVLHCVRAHRCKDVMPETIEAKIIACADSASHMTDSLYMDMAKDDKALGVSFRVYGKMDRDFGDMRMFPEMKKILNPLYRAWKKTIREYENIDI